MSYTHTTRIRVRYGETDQMGFVYYGVYAQYFEVGRVEALRHLGFTYADLEKEHGIWMPVMSMQVRFLRPSRYDDLLSVETTIPTLPEKDIVFRYELKNEAQQLLTGAEVKLCFLDSQTGKRTDIPLFLKEILIPYFKSSK